MASVSDTDRKAFETYILAKSDEERQEAIKRLIPGSQLYYKVYFIDRIKSCGSKFKAEDDKILQQYKKKYGKMREFKELEKHLLLVKFDDASTEDERKKALAEINSKFLNLTFNHSKQSGLAQVNVGLEDDLSSENSYYNQNQIKPDLDLDDESSSSQIKAPSTPQSISSLQETYQEQEQFRAKPKPIGPPHQQQQLRSRIPQMNVQQSRPPVSYQIQPSYLNSQSQDDESEEIENQYDEETEQIAIGRIESDASSEREIQTSSRNSEREIQAEQRQTQAPQTDKSTFNYDQFFSKKELQKLYQPSQNESQAFETLNKLPKGKEHSLDFTKFNPKAVYKFACGSGSKRIAEIENPTFFEALKAGLNQLFKDDKHFTLNQNLCNMLTLSQLTLIKTLHEKVKDDKVFIGSYFEKVFHNELSTENQALLSIPEKRENLLTLFNYAVKEKMPTTLQSSLLIEILELGLKLGVFDETLFREYIAMPLFVSQNLFKDKKRKANQDSHWNNYIGNVQSQNVQQGSQETTQQGMINSYLEHFCQQKGSLVDFKDDFDKTLLKKIEEKIEILNSDDMTNLNVDIQKYQSISQETIVRFLESNLEEFKVADEVILTLELKNIQTLYAKIFEFNTETYYKKTLQPFNTDVNLDGLVASNEKTFEYSHPPNRKFVETFRFDELAGKTGLFIIEFIGNGMSSRAIIKKGSLTLIHKPTIAGHQAFILDEQKRICTGPKTQVFFDGQTFEANPDTGKIFIPFGKTEKREKAIILANGFAQLCDFTQEVERYTFNSVIILNGESILTGNKASVVIMPFLQINKRNTSLAVLKKAKVTLTTNSYIQSLPITKTFEDIKFKDNREVVIEFQVPPYLSDFKIKVECEIFNVSQQKTESYSSHKSFQILQHSSSYNMNELFLRKEGNEFYVYVLGKNGEAKPGVEVKIQAVHSISKDKVKGKQTLVTDLIGRVKLGPMKHIYGISASCQQFSLEAGWILDHSQQQITYPESVDIVENESLEFPVSFKTLKREKISLIRTSQGKVLEDKFSSIKLVLQPDRDFNKVEIGGLQDGEYQLKIKDSKISISITVHKGKYWYNESFILKRNMLCEFEAQNKMIKIAKLTVEEAKEQESRVSINLDDWSKDTRVHVFATQFHSTCPHMTTQNIMSKALSQAASGAMFPFAMWKNIFLSNRELSDEFRYVFDRKYAQRYLGNTLERPRLVLKRNFVQATSLDQAQLKQGTHYPTSSLNNYQPAFYQQVVAKKKIKSKKVDYKKSSLKERVRNRNLSGSDLSDDSDDLDMDRIVIPEFQNFLKNSPLCMQNLVPSANGTVSFSANLSPYTQLYVFAIDKTSVASKSHSLEIGQISKRDLSLSAPLNSDKGFTESRTSKVISSGETILIDDITSTEIQLVDDLKKVKTILEQLLNQSYNNQSTFKELAPVFIQWKSFSQESKNKFYSKYFCHEVNLFIYFKDQQYFNEVARSFISQKMEKDFIDYYLLGEYDEVCSFGGLGVSKLNVLETCLLVDALVKQGEHDAAKRVCSLLKDQSDAQENRNVNHENQVFDTVLNLNMLKTSEIDDGTSSDTHSLGGGLQTMQLTAPSYNYGQENIYLQSRSIAAPVRIRDRSERKEQSYNRNRNRSYGEEEDCENQNMFGDSYGDDDDCDEMEVFREQMVERSNQKRKAQVKFEEVQQTNEYAETNFFKNQSPNIQVNSFWTDYSQYLLNPELSKRSFTSIHFTKNTDNSFSSLMTLALLDLPLSAEPHAFKTQEGRGVAITASSNLILFKKEVKETEVELKNDIMVTHRYASCNESEPIKAIPDEFLVNTAYSCEIIMTNVSPQSKEFSVLYQIPQSSLPLEQTKYMKSIPQSLSSYTTNKVKFYFYFPSQGTFSHFPSNISQEEKITSRASPQALKVVKTLSVAKKETFSDIVNGGSLDEIITFMKTHNLAKGEKGFAVGLILHLLSNKDFFLQVIEVLRSRLMFEYDVWTYGFYHLDELTCKELLNQSELFGSLDCGDSKLYSPKRKQPGFRHLDYFPLINARAHQVGDVEMWSLNVNFRKTYSNFLEYLLPKRSLSNQDKLNFAYYLLLQDRINDAISMHSQVILPSGSESMRIQYDYMSAYFDFFNGASESFKVARTIVRQYEDHPNSTWRLLFLEILDQLNEYDGEVDELVEIDIENMTEEQKKFKQKQALKKEPVFNVEVSSELQQISAELANIKAVSIKFYIIDVEILFSRTPFLKESSEEFSYVKPCFIIEKEINQGVDLNASIDSISTVNLGQGPQKFEVDIPEHLKNQNMVIEINGDGRQVFKTYYSSQLRVNIQESYGELKVTDRLGQPLSKVYVKIFYQKKSQALGSPALFFKDGYTDIRGKFEYAQTSQSKLNEVQRFAILVMSDDAGSIIRECNPPKIKESATDASDEPAY